MSRDKHLWLSLIFASYVLNYHVFILLVPLTSRVNDLKQFSPKIFLGCGGKIWTENIWEIKMNHAQKQTVYPAAVSDSFALIKLDPKLPFFRAQFHKRSE